MKILQVNSVCGIGSTGRIVTDLHGVYEKVGFESYIAYGREQSLNCDKKRTIKIGTSYDTYKHVLKTRMLDQHGFASKKATMEFIEKIRGLDPDIIHLHNIHGYYVNIEILFDYLKELNKPVIWTLHDCWAFTGHCAYFDYSGCECWKPSGNHHCIQKQNYPASWLINNSKNNYKRKEEAFKGLQDLTIITPSQWLADLVKKSFLRDYPIEVINNGINLNVFKPVKSKFREVNKLLGKYIILGVANEWDERKGLKYFKELANIIGFNEKIILVGLNANQIKNLPPNILGISKTDNIQELVEIYSTSDVFVNPTLEDNFPTVNLEALACGTPVITFDSGGAPEMLSQYSGLVTQEKTAKSILEGIQDVKQSRISKKSCKLRGEQFSKEKMTYQYEQLIKKILI